MEILLETDRIIIRLPEILSRLVVTDNHPQRLLLTQLYYDVEAEGAAPDMSAFTLPLTYPAKWPDDVATQAGLPPKSPFPLDLKLSAGIGKAGTKIGYRWLKPGTALPLTSSPQLDGLILTVQGQKFRVTEPFFSAIRLADEFNKHEFDNPSEQFRIWAKLKEHLGETNVSRISDGFLRSLRIVRANAISVASETGEDGHPQIRPIPMYTEIATSGEVISKVALPEADQASLPKLLDDLPEETSAFPLQGGVYLVVDDPVKKAMTGIRKLRASSPKERKNALLNPEAVISEAIGEDPFSGTNLFVETENFSDRVMDIGDWDPPVLPWIKIASQNWTLPDGSETAGIRIGTVDLPLKREDIGVLKDQIQRAMADGNPVVTYEGVDVPSNPETFDALSKLQNRLTGGSKSATDNHGANSDVFIIRTNFDSTDYARSGVGPRAGSLSLPHDLKTMPKEHQAEGIKWLQQHWISGSKGALLADDMGLGKTLQALAFCSWLISLMSQGIIAKQPILIVAPVGLLKNWEIEQKIHLETGLGTCCRAYGEYLKILKSGSHKTGTAKLDVSSISNADWVLANYETVSEYQMTFGAVKFAAVIFDEAQKIKNPSARMTHAAKALNAEFVLAMTGTPVENRLADLWCISDTVQPGALADLRSFSSRYEGATDESNLMELRKLIWHEPDSPQPKLMLRRLKSEKLKGLPQKHAHFIQYPMPAEQMDCYKGAIDLHKLSEEKSVLGLLQSLRTISLHPGLYSGGDGASLRPEFSARFSVLIELLDKIREKNEKALIFVESLELQEAHNLPEILFSKYGLRRPPMVINGEIKTAERQKRVDLFQQEEGFDVMLLSPKAGGVGITLTAANHVIHLSRWWNPAVEDQCSDRVYRIGQTKDVHIYYPMAIYPAAPDFSFDIKLNQLMERKRNLSAQMLAPASFSGNDFEELASEVSKI